MGVVSESPVCPSTPTVLNIRKFLYENSTGHGWSQQEWLLAYAHVLQCMGEATDGRTWRPNGKHFTPQISMLVDPSWRQLVPRWSKQMWLAAGVSHHKLSCGRGMKAHLQMSYPTLTIWLNACPQGRLWMSWSARYLLQCPTPHAGVGTWATYRNGW